MAEIFQKCADKCPDIFGADKELHPLFYEDKANRDKKTHTKNLFAAMMKAYRHLFDKNKAAWDNSDNNNSDILK